MYIKEKTMNLIEVMTKLVDSNIGKRLAAFLGSIYGITQAEDTETKIIIAVLCAGYMICQTVSDHFGGKK